MSISKELASLPRAYQADMAGWYLHEHSDYPTKLMLSVGELSETPELGKFMNAYKDKPEYVEEVIDFVHNTLT